MTTELAREALRYAAQGRATAVTIGVFDGVHRGHQHLIGHLLERASQEGLMALVVTFYPHPRLVLGRRSPDLSGGSQSPITYLCSLEDRLDLLRSMGVVNIAIIPFTSRFAQTSARDFVMLLVQEAGLRLLVAGADFALGRDREGTTAVLTKMGQKLGFSVEVVPLLTDQAGKVGSSAIRAALARGDMADVAELLGRPFSLHGVVVRGARRGQAIGFPTANLAVGADQALPAFGVYVTKAYVGAVGEPPLQAVTNIGIRPTFGETRPTVETYILDFQGDLYDKELRIELLDRLRDEMRFADLQQLVTQIQTDVAAARRILA